MRCKTDWNPENYNIKTEVAYSLKQAYVLISLYTQFWRHKL